MHSTKNKLLSLLCFLCMLLSLFAVLPASSFAVSVENPIKSWDLIPELHSGNNLNDSAYTGRCSVWQINVEKGGTTGDFMRMTFTNDGYVDASGEDLTHAKFSSSSKDGYVSPGRNGATGRRPMWRMASRFPKQEPTFWKCNSRPIPAGEQTGLPKPIPLLTSTRW